LIGGRLFYRFVPSIQCRPLFYWVSFGEEFSFRSGMVRSVCDGVGVSCPWTGRCIVIRLFFFVFFIVVFLNYYISPEGVLFVSMIFVSAGSQKKSKFLLWWCSRTSFLPPFFDGVGVILFFGMFSERFRFFDFDIYRSFARFFAVSGPGLRIFGCLMYLLRFNVEVPLLF